MEIVFLMDEIHAYVHRQISFVVLVVIYDLQSCIIILKRMKDTDTP